MILQVERVTKSYTARGRGKAPRTVLDSFSLDLEENELVTVLGPSGCGKSTLLRLVAGFERPDSGRIRFGGREIAGPDPDRVVVFQQPELLPWLDVRANIAFGLSLRSRKLDWERVGQIIDVVGLTGFERHAPHELSGGMQQRVALARALIMAPRMLLLDEPFAALDAYLRRSMQEFLLEIWDRFKTTILFITHDVDEAILLGDRMIVMGSSPGRILAQHAVGLARPRAETVLDHPRFRELRTAALAALRSPDSATDTAA